MIPFSVLKGPVLRARLDKEAEEEGGNGEWVAFTTRHGGAIVELSSNGRPATPDPVQVMFGQDMARALNKHLHHDGHWLVQFTVPPTADVVDGVALPIIKGVPIIYQRFAFIFMDRDGDVQFINDCVSPFHECLMEGPDPWMERCEEAWRRWNELRKSLDLKEGHTFKAALGERAPSRDKVH